MTLNIVRVDKGSPVAILRQKSYINPSLQNFNNSSNAHSMHR